MAANSDLCADSPLAQIGLNYSLYKLTDDQRTFTRGYLIFGIILNAFCLAVWMVEKGKYERTRVRPTIFLVMAILCSLAVQGCGPLNSISPRSYPCWVGVILLAMTIPFGAVSIVGRHMLYSFLTRFAKAAGRLQVNVEDLDGSISVQTDLAKEAWASRFSRAKGVAAMVVFSNREPQSEEELQNLKFLSSRPGTMIITALFSLPVLIASIIIVVSDPVVLYCTNCGYSEPARNMIVIALVICFGIGISFWFVARGIKSVDKWGLKNECAITIVAYAIGLCGYLSSLFTDDSTEKNLSPYTHNFLLTLGMWLAVIEQSLVQVVLARLGERKLSQLRSQVRHNEKTLQSSSKSDELEEILNDRESSEAFEKHLIAELGVESLYFLKQCEQWLKAYFDVSPTARLSRAKKIFKTYIDTSGLYAVNVSARVNESIETKLYRAGVDDCPREIFEDAIREIRQMLLMGAVLRFRMARENSSIRSPNSAVAVSTTVSNIT